jgi:hypothetical protein
MSSERKKGINETSWGVHDRESLNKKSDEQSAKDKEYSEKLKSYIKDINELIKNNKLSEEDMEIINEALETASSKSSNLLPMWKFIDLEKAVGPIFLKVSKN